MKEDRKIMGSHEPVTTSEAEREQVRARVLEMGFKDDVKILGGEVLVEGCYSFPKEKFLGERKSLGKVSHRRSHSLVDQTAVRSVTVRVDATIPNTGVGGWHWATQQAINAWNAVNQTSVNFIFTTALSADVTVKSDGTNLGGAYAVARTPCADVVDCFGTSQNPRDPGNRILVNMVDYASLGSEAKKSVMTHNLGHTVGLMHTDGTVAGVFIEQTPMEAASVMWSTFGPTDPNPPSITGWDMVAASALYPNYERLGGPVWDKTVAMTSWGGYLYIIHNSRLYRVDPATGGFTVVGGPTWDKAVAITAHGSYLYILHSSRLYRVDPTFGTFAQIGGVWWDQARALVSDGTHLYILHASQIYRVDSNVGSFTAIGSATWTNAPAMTILGANLYVVQNAALYEVSTITGAHALKGGSVYVVPPIKMTARGSYLYIVENSALNRTETNGAYVHGQDPIWSTTRAMTSMGDYVYIVQGSHLVKVYKMEI